MSESLRAEPEIDPAIAVDGESTPTDFTLLHPVLDLGLWILVASFLSQLAKHLDKYHVSKGTTNAMRERSRRALAWLRQRESIPHFYRTFLLTLQKFLRRRIAWILVAGAVLVPSSLLGMFVIDGSLDLSHWSDLADERVVAVLAKSLTPLLLFEAGVGFLLGQAWLGLRAKTSTGGLSLIILIAGLFIVALRLIHQPLDSGIRTLLGTPSPHVYGMDFLLSIEILSGLAVLLAMSPVLLLCAVVVVLYIVRLLLVPTRWLVIHLLKPATREEESPLTYAASLLGVLSVTGKLLQLIVST